SAVRAAVMLALSELARLSGRMPDPLTALVLAVALMGLADPRVLFDVGMQLSASATLGIILLWPSFRRALRSLPRWIAEPGGLTLAVSLATLPVNLTVFDQVSLVSPLAHVVAMPLVPLVMCTAALLALIGSITPGSGLENIAAHAAWVASWLLTQVVSLFGGLPGAAISTGNLAPATAIGLACAILAFAVWQQPDLAALRARSRPYHAPFLTGATALLSVCVILLTRPDGQLHVQLLSHTTSGEAVFIRGPTGQTALVVVGRVNGVAVLSELQATLPVWEHGIDTLVVLDPAADSGVGSVVERYPARQVVNTETDVALGGGARLGVDPAVHSATLTSGASVLTIPGGLSGEP
ncbi:MAG: ComEC/Rec2 family competence protein, partial [Chloroflexi bacterium]|nr:ComEC/Rec2 family competence protein [Chloroflexota bacterium]